MCDYRDAAGPLSPAAEHLPQQILFVKPETAVAQLHPNPLMGVVVWIMGTNRPGRSGRRCITVNGLRAIELPDFGHPPHAPAGEHNLADQHRIGQSNSVPRLVSETAHAETVALASRSTTTGTMSSIQLACLPYLQAPTPRQAAGKSDRHRYVFSGIVNGQPVYKPITILCCQYSASTRPWRHTKHIVICIRSCPVLLSDTELVLSEQH